MPGGVMTSANNSVAANATTGNIMAGKVFEFVPAPSIIKVYINAAAVGMNADVLVGNESYLNDEEVSNANRFPIRNEDLLVELGALAGERIVIRLRNTTGAAIITNTLVEVQPL